MSSTLHYKPFQENESSKLSFSFDYLESKAVSSQEVTAKIRVSLQQILSERFTLAEKRQIHDKHGRYNFACPYCGDSHNDPRKKRGNLYYGEAFYYKCFNCFKYRNVEEFLKDFSQSKNLSIDELVFTRDKENRNSSGKTNIDPMLFLDHKNLERWAISRNEIEEKYRLTPLDRSKISVYLQKRLQPDMSKFSWNEQRQQLYIFHIIPGTNKVLGYQIRNFKTQPKYMTFKLSKIYEDFKLEVPEEVLEIDDISTTFGILEIDLQKPVTVFEGPLDSFLMKNSVATCSSGIDFPIQLGTLRYMYDYDAAGKKAAIQKAKDGNSIFLWKKLLTDIGILDPIKKMDLTDLLVLCKRKGIKLPRLSNYFSTNKYDLYDL